MLDATRLISEQLIESAYDPAAWPVALNSINAFVNGSGVALLSVEERLRHAPCSSDLQELMADYFDNGWYLRDRREGCRQLLLQKGLAFDHDFVDIGSLEAFYGDYYDKFLAKHNRKWFAGLSANFEGDLWCLALQRSAAKGPFEKADLQRLEAIRMRFTEAAALARIVSCHWIEGALAAFDSDDTAALLLDRDGRILEMSVAARLILGPRPASLDVRYSTNANLSQPLDRILRSQIASRLSGYGKKVSFNLRIGVKAYALEATSLLGVKNLAFSRTTTLVRISPYVPDVVSILKERHGLTNAEARVAKALASGHDVQLMGEMFNVTTNTIRAQLKSAYAKTGASNQAKLAAFVLRLS